MVIDSHLLTLPIEQKKIHSFFVQQHYVVSIITHYAKLLTKNCNVLTFMSFYWLTWIRGIVFTFCLFFLLFVNCVQFHFLL